MTVTPDASATISDFYDYLRVDASLDAGKIAQENGQEMRAYNLRGMTKGDVETLLEVTHTFEQGPIVVNASLKGQHSCLELLRRLCVRGLHGERDHPEL